VIKTAEIVTRDGEVIPLSPTMGLPGAVTTRNSLILPEGMTELEWCEAGEKIEFARQASQWWVGDWWIYGDFPHGRRKEIVESPDWQGPSYQTCKDAAWVASTFERSRRRDLSFLHHREAAALPPAEADAVLDWAQGLAREGVPPTIREMRKEVARIRAPDHLSLAEHPSDGKYNVIVIDPPWEMEKIEREVRPNQREFDYPTMSEEELAEFGVADVAADDCHLFCWTTHKFLPVALRLVEGWGFRYVLEMVWHKPGGFQPVGLPQYNCEFVVYARCGAPKFVETKAFNCCFQAPRREHSRKPDEFYDMVRRVTNGRRLDIFSREKRPGFDQFGNEADKFAGAA
jgi:N6-adenosine-specific RNA methylase IME4